MTTNGSITPALELEGVTAGYGGTLVLRDATLSVAPHSIVTLLGPNGAGKTTLLRVAAGTLGAKEGIVRVFGEDVSGASPTRRARQGLCLIPEGRGVFPSLTVAENLRLLAPPWEGEDRVEEALEAFPVLRDRLGQVAGSMSGGEQQMLALARIHLARPRVVLLDEVSMGLAPLVVDQIFEHIVKLARSGIALLLVEQYVNRALEVADHVYMMNHGALTFSGPPRELDEQAVLSSYLGSDLIGDRRG